LIQIKRPISNVTWRGVCVAGKDAIMKHANGAGIGVLFGMIIVDEARRSAAALARLMRS
jgi:hypothetical protein